MTCRDMSGCSVTHTLRQQDEERLHFSEESEEEMKEIDEEKRKGDEREGDENEGKDGEMDGDDDDEKKAGD